MSERSNAASNALYVYVWSVIASGCVVLAISLRDVHLLPHALSPAYGFFGALLFATEAKPIQWLKQRGGEVTASWTFAFALLLMGPIAGAVILVGAATFLSDVVRRKGMLRAVFNTAQVILSLSAAALVLGAGAHRDILVRGDAIPWSWLPVTILAGAAMFLTNGILTSVVLALHQGRRVGPTVRSGVGVNFWTDGMLIALAPIAVAVQARTLLLLPLLLVTAAAVYRSAYLALARQYEATHDLLTNLANRRHFYTQLTAALDGAGRRGDKVAVALLDLDGFKEINDRLGHEVGDQLLQELATRLREVSDSDDLVARLGGDEFAVLIRTRTTRDEAEQVAERLVAAMQRPCLVQGFPVSVQGSVGVAVFPEHGEDAETLLRHADFAMYLAKAASTSVRVYQDDSEGHGTGRLALLGELQGAMAAGQLRLDYQPKIKLATGQVVGAEALLRWHHPTLGIVLPGRFVALAEQTELMTPLTDFVLRRAGAQATAWHDAGLMLTVAVNGSARNLGDMRFAHAVEAILGELGLDPSWLELEITENTLLADLERARAVLFRLRAIGVRIALDDFGTGFSPLTVLRDLPVDQVKIADVFARGLASSPADRVIIGAVVEMSHRLGMEVVAEGIEDEQALAIARDLGCDFAQGYLLGMPVDGSQLAGQLHDSAAQGRGLVAAAAS